MNIHKKTLLILVSITLIAITSFYFIARYIIVHSYAQLEKEDLLQNLSIVSDSLDTKIQDLPERAQDWAYWDDALVFVQKYNQSFHDSNMTPQNMISLKVDAVAFLNNRFQIVDMTTVDTLHNRPLIFSENDIKKFTHPEIYPDHENILDYKSGYIKLNVGIFIFSSHNVTTSKRTGPAKGYLIFGQMISDKIEDRLKKTTHVDLELRPYQAEDLKLTTTEKVNDHDLVYQIIDDHKIYLFHIINDYNHQPILTIKVNYERKIYQQAFKIIRVMAFFIITVAILMVLAIFRFTEKYIVARIKSLSIELKQLKRTTDLSRRITVGGKDEITDLGFSINDMLQNIEDNSHKITNFSKMSALGEMASGIAHEINNPLAIILGFVDYLTPLLNEERSLDKNEFHDKLDKIKKHSLRIAKIVKGLRLFARNSDHDPFEDYSIATIFDDTLALCSEKIKNSGAILKYSLPFPTVTIACRPTEISQVLLNLIHNANDATELFEDRWIELEIIDQSDKVKIYVTDSGTGIPKEIQAKILEPFFTTKAFGKGTGLGLSLSKGIIEMHHGTLEIDNECKNTRFIVTLPKKQPVQADKSTKNAA